MGKTEALMEEIRRRMATRTLTAGEKLPSVRGFARAMKVSPSTVAEAYDRLVAEGVIRSRPGSGFYVAGSPRPFALAAIEPRIEREIDPLWVARQSLDADPGAPRPGCGWLPADWMPETSVRRALRTLARGEAAVLSDYGPARGDLPLRRLLARRGVEEGIDLVPEQILLTASGTQAFDLLCRFLLNPGDTVLVDDPCYFNFQALLRAHRVGIASVPWTPRGPDVALFEAAVETHRPRLYVTNSALHNPTGATLSPRTAHRLLMIAASHDMTIVEDDIFADFEPEPSVRLACLGGLERVVRIGSFSKTLSASVRCGYVVARRDWIEGLIDLQVATNFGGASPLAVGVARAVLGDGGYARHMARLRQRLSRCREEAIAALAPLGIAPWTAPRGGFTLWCRLPDGRDAGAVARLALKEGVVLAPGNVFSVARTAGDMMRFNVAHMDRRVIDILRRACGSAGARP